MRAKQFGNWRIYFELQYIYKQKKNKTSISFGKLLTKNTKQPYIRTKYSLLAFKNRLKPHCSS